MSTKTIDRNNFYKHDQRTGTKTLDRNIFYKNNNINNTIFL